MRDNFENFLPRKFARFTVKGVKIFHFLKLETGLISTAKKSLVQK